MILEESKMCFNDRLFFNDVNEIVGFLKDKENMVVIIGKGFDPRTTSFLEALSENNRDFSVRVIDYDGPTESNEINRSKENANHIENICRNMDYQLLKAPSYKKDDGHGKKTLIISESVRKISKEVLKDYKNIVVDISAMTKALSFCLINQINKKKSIEQKLYVVVTENSTYDDMIEPRVVDNSAEFLPGFKTFKFSSVSDEDATIWFPALGQNSKEAFRIINDFVSPDEICPILPFPSVRIKRAESILRNMGEVLFRENQIDKRNIILVPEESPQLVCKKLYQTIMYYYKALNVDGDKKIKFVFSSQSSKLIDLGILLTLIILTKSNKQENLVAFALVETSKYQIEAKYDKRNEKTYCFSFDDNELLW